MLIILTRALRSLRKHAVYLGQTCLRSGPRHGGHRGQVPPCADDPNSTDKGTHLTLG